jgi:hypothetical protein
MREDLLASRQPSATTTLTTTTTPIHKEKVCLQAKPQTRRYWRWRFAHWEGPRDNDLCNKKVPKAKIYVLRRSQRQRPMRRAELTIHVIGMAERKLKPKYEDTREINIKALGVSSFLS